MTRIPAILWLVSHLVLLSACARQVIPEELKGRVDRTLSFAQVKDMPVSYQGRLIAVGGEVLTVKRVADGTRIEALQLPLDNSDEPLSDRTASQGRFLAFQEGFLDPATLPRGTLVTMVGEVSGAMTLPLDEVEYRYPTLRVRHLKVWEREDSRLFPHITFGFGVIGSF